MRLFLLFSFPISFPTTYTVLTTYDFYKRRVWCTFNESVDNTVAGGQMYTGYFSGKYILVQPGLFELWPESAH